MREPFARLLGQYKDHPLIGKFVKGHVPDFEGMFGSQEWKSMSTTEHLMWEIALAFHTGAPEAKVRDLAKLDRDNLQRFAQALFIAKWTRIEFAKVEYELALSQINWDDVREGRL